MESGENTNGWEEWSKHVLKELERLNDNYESLNNKYSTLEKDLANIQNIKVTLNEVAGWKSAMMEVASPTQLKELKSDIEKLKTFRTASFTVWAVIQGLIVLWMALKELL